MPEPPLRANRQSYTRIAMEWDDQGAVVSSNLQILCPRCHAGITPGLEHRCGNRMLRAVKPAPAKKRAVHG